MLRLFSVSRIQAGQKLGRSCLPREVPGTVWLVSSPTAPSFFQQLGSRMRGLSGAGQPTGMERRPSPTTGSESTVRVPGPCPRPTSHLRKSLHSQSLTSWPWCVKTSDFTTHTIIPGEWEPSKPLTGFFPPSEIPGKPEIIDPASELMAGVPNKVMEGSGRSRKWCCECGCGPVWHLTFSTMRSPLFLQVGTCVSEGGYPEGTLSWHLDGKPLIPDGKGECQ